MSDVVDDNAESFEGADTEQIRVAGLCENDFIGGLKTFGPQMA